MKKLIYTSLTLLHMLLLAVAVSAQTETFRFAFFTDIHIGTPTAPKDLTDAINDVNSRTDIDFVLINGDLTELGTNAQLDEVKGMLDKLNKPYYAVAGNHETKWSESGNMYFSAAFGDNKYTFEHKGVRFIAVTSGPLLRMGDGHISPYDMRWIKSTLESMADKNTPVIFATHYQLMDDMDVAEDVIKMFCPYNVLVSFCGHGHRNRLIPAPNITNVMCRAVVSSGLPSGGYTIIEVSKDSLRFFEKNYDTDELRRWLSIPNKRVCNESDMPILSAIPKAVWQYQADGIIVAAATESQGKVVVGDETGRVYCLDLNTGKPIWTFKARNAVYSKPAIDGDRVVFGSCDSSVYCLNLTNGSKVWEYKTNHTVMGTPLINGKTVYIGGSDSCFRALDMKNGKLKWEFCGLRGYIESTPILYGGRLIFGAWDTYLYALNPKDGKLIWEWTNGKSMHMSPAACTPVAAHGKVFVVAPDRFMTALDASTGDIVWRSTSHKVRESIGISEDGETIYVRCFTDTLFAAGSAPNSYEEKWFANAGYGYDINPSMIQEANGRIYFTTKNGLFVVLDAANKGKVLWTCKLNNTIINTPTIIRDATAKGGVKLLFTTHDGIIGLIEPEK
ncbi:MAG: PQQ-binding-like beta-propeller repeat protein [Prevotellaceae bacterium]|jgi:outer membrane protein assembly factor BamB/predicted phosphodiesterase|nr:PQQ-binding-like beta-propeller repeat protein [Prevotellaceae bacterium]